MKKSLMAVALLTSVAMASVSSTRLTASTVSTSVIAVQLQTTRPNLSSPEKSVRSFVAALNASRFEDAAGCVDGASPRADFNEFRQMWNKEKLGVALSDLKVTLQGNKAVVAVRATFRSRAHSTVQRGNISLVRRDGNWLLVPISAQVLDANPKNVSWLAPVVTMLCSPEVLERWRKEAQRESCSSNLKQIALAAIMLAQDDEKLAITPQNFKTKLFTYSKTMQIFRCPDVASGESYSFNGNLTNLDMSKIEGVTASRLVMFYEGKNGYLDFRHLGTANVAFADGHVKAITRAEATSLKWKP